MTNSLTNSKLRRNFINLGAFVCSFLLYVQTATGADAIRLDTTATRISKHIDILCSPEYNGRSTLSGHDLKAISFVDSIFRTTGLIPYRSIPSNSFKQPVNIVCTTPLSSNISILGKTYGFVTDFINLGQAPKPLNNIDIVFGGTGDNDQLDSLDLNGKALFILTNNLRIGALKVHETAKRKGCVLIISANPTNNQQFSQIAQQVKSVNAATTYTLATSSSSVLTRSFSPNANPIPQILVSNHLAEAILGESPQKVWERNVETDGLKIIPSSLKVNVQFNKQIDTLKTYNVIGWIPSARASQRSIIVSAHLDHLVQNGQNWFPGADDNASGVALVIELAKRFASKKGYQFNSNIIFVAFTAEEIGLLGSQQYAKTPLFPADSTLVLLNFDMVGRVGVQKGRKKTLFINGNNKLEAFGEMAMQCNTDSTLAIDYKTLSKTSLFTISDHYHFEKMGLPSYLLTTGLHRDYHTPNDTPEKLSIEGIAQIADYIETLIIEIDRLNRILPMDTN